MGLLDSLFPKDTEKAAWKQFQKEEANAAKWPSRFYSKVLDVYLTGEFNYYYAEQGDSRWHLYHFPELIDHEKAIALCRAGADPKNIKKTRSRMGKVWRDPGEELRLYLVGLLPDGPEREQLIRSKWHNNYTVAYYVYRMGWVDRYCKTLEDKLTLYDLIVNNPPQPADRGDDNNYGVDRWKYEEMLGGVFYKTRRRQGKAESEKLLKSRNKAERDIVSRFVKQKAQERQDKNREDQQYYLELARFARDELDARFFDPTTGKKYRMKEDDTYVEADD